MAEENDIFPWGTKSRDDYAAEYTDDVMAYLDSLPPRDVAKTIAIYAIQGCRATMRPGESLDMVISFFKQPETIASIAEMVQQDGTKATLEYLVNLPDLIAEGEFEDAPAEPTEGLAPKLDRSGHVVTSSANDDDDDSFEPVLSDADYDDIMG